MGTEQKKFYTGQDIADELGLPGIKVRSYIRRDGTRVGRGKQYHFTAEQALQIARHFDEEFQGFGIEEEDDGTIVDA